MGITCSKSSGALDEEYHLNQYRHHRHSQLHSHRNGYALESDPRYRRRSKKKKRNGSLSALSSGSSTSSPYHNHHHQAHGRVGGIYKWDPPLFAVQQKSLSMQLLQNGEPESSMQYGQQQQESAPQTGSPKEVKSSMPPSAGQYHLLFKAQQKSARNTGTCISSASNIHYSSSSSSLSVPQSPSAMATAVTIAMRKRREDLIFASQNVNVEPNAEEDISGGSIEVNESGEALCSSSANHPGSTSTERVEEPPMTSRLVVRHHAIRTAEEGLSGSHIYVVRWPRKEALQLSGCISLPSFFNGHPEQSPYRSMYKSSSKDTHVLMRSSFLCESSSDNEIEADDEDKGCDAKGADPSSKKVDDDKDDDKHEVDACFGLDLKHDAEDTSKVDEDKENDNDDVNSSDDIQPGKPSLSTAASASRLTTSTTTTTPSNSVSTVDYYFLPETLAVKPNKQSTFLYVCICVFSSIFILTLLVLVPLTTSTGMASCIRRAQDLHC